ncbi:hypothetical protein [Aliikangiella sp. IMCC44359]|uniref:hypothetical protein n=1 Tax=Aliikangiella sp. IMCC44359 TaxID=3459125 RepID=UPI00403AA910
MIDIESIDRYVSQQGNFCLIDWLISDNFLKYSDYEIWRYGKNKTLDDSVLLDAKSFSQIIEDSEKHCKNLGLIAEPQSFHSWDPLFSEPLIASHHSLKNKNMLQRWIRPQNQPQLDLFMDNSEHIAEQAVINYLAERQFKKAQVQLKKLTDLNSENQSLGNYQDLVNYGLHILSNPTIEQSALKAEYDGLKNEVVKLAKEMLSSVARDYLAFAWRRIAKNLAEQPFNKKQPELHQSCVLMEIPDYAATVECLLKEKELLQDITLLERLAVSYEAIHEQEKSLLTWCFMMEIDNENTASKIEAGCSKINYLWQDFWEDNSDWSERLFPAYILMRQPSLIHFQKELALLKDPITLAVIDLIRIKIAGENEIEARKALQLLSPDLLSFYLK